MKVIQIEEGSEDYLGFMLCDLSLGSPIVDNTREKKYKYNHNEMYLSCFCRFRDAYYAVILLPRFTRRRH